VAEVTIAVADLRVALSKVLAEAERELGPEIDLGADAYWDVPAEVAYSVTSDPPGELVVGQLADDAESVRQIVASDEVLVWHDLAHLAAVLRRVAEVARP
jgi:hypothetical protein